MTTIFNVKAILIGIVTMLGASFLMGLVMTVATIISPRFLDDLIQIGSNNLNYFLFIGAIIPCFIGGFITGYITKHDRLKNAFALAILSVIMRESAALFSGHGSIIYRLVGETAGIITIICGGCLAKLFCEGKM